MTELEPQKCPSTLSSPSPPLGERAGVRGCVGSIATITLFLFLALTTFAKSPSPLDYSDISKPEFFPVLPWDPYHGWSVPNIERNASNDLHTIADCSFNMAGFVLPRDLPLCRQTGLGALMLPRDAASTNIQYVFDWKKLSDAEIDRRVKANIDGAGHSRNVMGYFITDEPGAADFPALGKAVAAVKKYAPGKLAYINLFPDYATLGAPDTSQLGTASYTEYLERFVNEVHPQLISYDNYMVEFSNDLKNRGQTADYFHNLLEVRRVAQKYHLPYLNIVSANQIVSNATIPSPANLALQAYTTLAAGYRGVTWYTYYSQGYSYAPMTDSGHKTPTWNYLREVNRQILALAPIMCHLESTGVLFSAPAPADNLPMLPGQLVASATCPTPLMLGEFRGPNNQAYVMVVNLSLASSAKFDLKTVKPDAVVKIISPIDRSLSPYDPKAGHWLPAGQGVLLKVD